MEDLKIEWWMNEKHGFAVNTLQMDREAVL
jgi:hypothetical protein